VEKFAAHVQHHLEALGWHRQREILRALVRQVEIGLEQIHVVFRVDGFAGEVGPEKKVCNFVRGVASPILSNIYLDRLDQFVAQQQLPEYNHGHL
jgi:hypothetical protein